MRIAAGIMFLLLLLCVVVQYNDTDPIRWMLLYGAGAGLSVAAFFGRYTPVAPVLLMLYLAIAAYLMPAWNPSEVVHLLRQPKMIDSDHNIELAREAVGLLIAAVWMAVLSRAWWKKNRLAGASTPQSQVSPATPPIR